MLELNATVSEPILRPPGATPTIDRLPRRIADFGTLGEALDYAAPRGARTQFPRCAWHADARLSVLPSCAPIPWRWPRASSPWALRRATVSPWSLKPAPISPPASSVPSMRAPAGAAAAADQLRRPRRLRRPARGSARQLRPEAVPVPQRTRGFLQRRRRQARHRRPRVGIAIGRRTRARALFRRQAPTTSLTSNIRAARRASRMASPSLTKRSRQPSRPWRRPRGRRHRPLHFVAALVPRHGPGRLLPVADRAPAFGRLSEDRGLRPPSARLARHDQPQSRNQRQLLADLRL